MKKVLMIITLFFTIILSGCQLIGLSKIAIASNNMEELDSYRMDLEIDVTNIMTITGTASVDGDYTEMVMDGETTSMFEKNGSVYTIDRNWLGLPVLVEEEDEEEEENYDDFSLYKDYDFEQDGEYYVLTDGTSDLFEDMETLKIRIENNYITEMILEGVLETYEMVLTITFSEFNNVELTPPLYVSEETIMHLEERMEELGFIGVDWGGATFGLAGTIGVNCGGYGQFCHIESASGVLLYHPINETLQVCCEGTPEPYETMVTTLQDEEISTEMIEFIGEFYFLYHEYSQ
jgi:hypothetical protein